MKAQTVSTYAANLIAQKLVSNTKNELVKAQTEATTQKMFDVGLGLGARAGQALNLQKYYSGLEVQLDTNKLLQERMALTQTSMKAINDQVQAMLAQLPSAGAHKDSETLLVNSAKNVMRSVTGLLNTSFNGEYIFGGLNVDKMPIGNSTQNNAASAALKDIFEQHFGFGIGDPQVAQINADDMRSFLQTKAIPQFDGAAWTDHWSNASGDNRKSQIATNEVVKASVSANAAGFRDAFAGLAIINEFAAVGLNSSTVGALVETVANKLTSAVTNLTTEQGKLGLVEAKVKEANDRIATQQKVLNQSFLDLVGVDPYEAATKVNLYVNQLETSYALTARLQKLSLINYLR